MKLINCTPHELVINGQTYKPSGVVPRIKKTPVSAGTINSIPAVWEKAGEVENLPDPQEGVLYIVSAMVFDNTPRKDVVAPDTGPTAQRNDKGHITGVTQIRVKPPNAE